MDYHHTDFHSLVCSCSNFGIAIRSLWFIRGTNMATSKYSCLAQNTIDFNVILAESIQHLVDVVHYQNVHEVPLPEKKEVKGNVTEWLHLLPTGLHHCHFRARTWLHLLKESNDLMGAEIKVNMLMTVNSSLKMTLP